MDNPIALYVELVDQLKCKFNFYKLFNNLDLVIIPINIPFSQFRTEG